MKHTPTPWKAAKDTFGNWRLWDNEGNDLFDQMGDAEEEAANAKHAAHCVNLFDELVDVATEFLAVCHVTGRTSDAKRVQALIAKAESTNATL